MAKKILFIASHRLDRAPGQRYRFEQYFSYLEKHGFECKLSYVISKKDDKKFYAKGNYVSKLLIFFKSIIIRTKDALAAPKYDIIFIFREALMTKHIFFEKLFAKSGAKLVFDFDDAIWLPTVSAGNERLSWLKDAGKTPYIISLCNMVFAGNRYLADYASDYCNNVKVVPTTIDTDLYKKIDVPKMDDRVCIGWSGSFTTIEHFEYGLPYLKAIKKKYGDKVYFKVVGDATYLNEELGIQGIAWNKEEEIAVISSFDIGIMPLPDDEWSKGKCGFKGLLYMSFEVPAVMSAVGVNKEIIQDRVNGFLATDMEEWVDKLSLLIESAELRKKLGKAGRATVIEKYSVISQRDNYVKYLNEVLTT